MSFSNRIPQKNLQQKNGVVSINDKHVLNNERFVQVETERMLEEAKMRIAEEENRVMREIQEKREQVFNNAYEEGKKTALQEAKEQLREEFEAVLQEANAIYQEANAFKEKLIEKQEEEFEQYLIENRKKTIDLAVLIANKIFGKEIELGENDLERLLQNGLEKIRYDNKKIIVRVHPNAEKILNQSERFKHDRRLVFVTDLTVQPMDSILETEREFVDLTVENQLNEIKNYLYSVYEQEYSKIHEKA